MKDNIIKSKSFVFPLKIIKLCQHLTEAKKEYVLSKQLLRASTAVGVLVREAEHAISKTGFIHKLSIGLKEAKETGYGLELLQQPGYPDENNFKSFDLEIKEIWRLLISIIKSSKQK